MSARVQPGLAAAVWRLTAFDLHNMSGHLRAWLTITATPALLLVMGVWFDFMMGLGDPGPAPPREVTEMVVVWPDESMHEALSAELNGRWRHTVVVATAPTDLTQRLDRGELDVIVYGPASKTSELRVEAGPGVADDGADRHREDVGVAILHALTTLRAGPEPSIATPKGRTDGRAESAATDTTSSSWLELLGIAAITLLGGMTGVETARTIHDDPKRGFSTVLAVGTPAVALYANSMIVHTLFVTTAAASWWLLYLIGHALVPTLGTEPPLAEVGLLTPVVLLLLVVLTCVSTISILLVLLRIIDDLPGQLRGAVTSSAILMPAVVLWAASYDIDALRRFTDSDYLAVPIWGAIPAWMALLSTDAPVLPWLALHSLYAAVLLRLGAWAYLLDESPLTSWRRRWR